MRKATESMMSPGSIAPHSGNGRPGAWVIAGGRTLCASAPFGVMGIVNLTPDSFYDGGCHADAVSGLAHALKLRDDGADVLDIGAESSRPGAAPLSPDEELRRLCRCWPV